MEMQTVKVKRGNKIIHVETRLGIVNIYLGLTNREGQAVETVSMNPNRYAGERKVIVRGYRFVQLKTRN